jgi:hypothetical protein
MIKSTCSNCEYAIFHDYGYSNYTVEGTTFYCAINKHPDGAFDRWYGESERLQFAEECDSFTEGDPIELDVEFSEEYDLKHLTEKEAEIYYKWKNNQ